jgi:MFS family permease
MPGVRSSAFRRLLASWYVSMVGDGVRMAALPLYAAVTTGSPLVVGAVAAAELLPWLLVGLLGGALADRVRPRGLLVAADLGRAVVAGVLALAVLAAVAGPVVLVAASFLLAVGETVASPATQVALVHLAGRQDLHRANTRYTWAQNNGILAGMLLAGVLFSWQPASCFAFDAATFVVSAALVRGLPEGAAPDRSPGGTLQRRIVDGVRFVFGHPALRVQILAVVVSAVTLGAYNALINLYGVQVLRLPPAVVPGLVAAEALAGLVGAAVAPAVSRRWGETRTMMTAFAVIGGAVAVLGLVHQRVLAFAGAGAVGLGIAVWNVLSATRRQRLTPGPMMGRMASTYQLMSWGTMPLGSVLAGPLAAMTSVDAVLTGAGLLLISAVALMARPFARTEPAVAEPALAAREPH